MDCSSKDKTLVLGQNYEPVPESYGACPVCSTELILDSEMLVCPVCGYSSRKRNDFQPGNVIREKYRILSSIDSGGCGNIFLCYPVNDASVRYVLKVLKNNDQPGLQKRFIREAQILQGMKNERIVQLIDYWTDASGSYIVLEYITGKDLRTLRYDYEFDEESVLLIAREVAYALQYALSFSVIHRDIKPENIMLDQENHIKLLDFGLSKNTDSETQSQITMENAGLGTPGYMSPEQFNDFKHSDFRSDIYSIGATMVLLFTGVAPFSGNNVQEIFNSTIANSPPPAEKLAPYCSEGCIQLIQWMMQRNPEQRPSSYEELIQKINDLLDKKN